MIMCEEDARCESFRSVVSQIERVAIDRKYQKRNAGWKPYKSFFIGNTQLI